VHRCISWFDYELCQPWHVRRKIISRTEFPHILHSGICSLSLAATLGIAGGTDPPRFPGQSQYPKKRRGGFKMTCFIHGMMRFYRRTLVAAAAVTLALVGSSTAWAANDSDNNNRNKSVELVFIHSGDAHGDLEPHPNLRAGSAEEEGGMARLAYTVRKIREKHPDNSIHVHTGDTISGSAVATFTRGEALVKVVDQLGIDAFTPGNWEFSYGVYRFLQYWGTPDDIETIEGDDWMTSAIGIPPFEQGAKPTFGKPFPDAYRWGAVASNVYINGTRPLDVGVADKGIGNLLTRPYKIIEKKGVKVGIFGCTTNRGPQVVSSFITRGISFSNCKGEVRFPQNRPINWNAADTPHPNQDPNDPDNGFRVDPEIPKMVKQLREVEGVDIVVLLSEAGIAENIYNAENFDGIDLIFSSDMHERTLQPVVVTQPSGGKTIIMEEGEDAAQVGELEVTVKNGKLRTWEWRRHDITEDTPDDAEVAALVEEVQHPYEGDGFEDGKASLDPWYYTNPYNDATLDDPLDTVIGTTEVEISRNRYSNEFDPDNFIMPGVIEGTGHNIIVDAFRALLDADVGEIRGFRYTNTIPPGEIELDDLYHYMPIGPQVASAPIPSTPVHDDKVGNLDWPRNLLQNIELGGNSTMNPLVTRWSGGWAWDYSGITLDFDPFAPNFNPAVHLNGSRVSNLKLWDGTPLVDVPEINYASYYYDGDPNRINRNQIVPGGRCNNQFPGDPDALRKCVEDKILILAKKPDGTLVMVNPVQYRDAREAGHILVVDAVEAVRRYIAGTDINVYDLDGALIHTALGLGGNVEAAEMEPFPRYNLLKQLVDSTIEFGFPAIEPLRGAPPPGFVYPPDYISGVADRPEDDGKF
jgi:sulfur-oxidizing protein SoxB